MKKLFASIVIIAALPAAGQDFCKQVKKEVSDDKTQVDYASPAAADHITPVLLKRTVNTNPEFAMDNFTVVFQMASPLESIYTKTADGSEREKQEKKLLVQFDDNTTFVDDTIDITHDFTEDRTMAIRNLYYPVTDASINQFASKKIVKFSLAGNERAIPADSANAILHYFQCIRDKK